MTTSRRFTEAELQELRDRNPCPTVAGQWVQLRRKGTGFIGPCPIHSPNPDARDSTSFECWADRWVCATCADGGDVIRLVELREGVDFVAAVERLGGVRAIDPAEDARRSEELKRKREKAEQDSARYRESARATAFDIWLHGTPIAGSSAERYLALRGIVAPPGLKARVIEQMPYYADGKKDAAAIHRGPALLLPILRDGRFSGLHITYIDLNQPKGKLALRDDDGALRPAKKVRGSKSGGHIVVHGASDFPANRLVIGEGFEKVAAVYRAELTRGEAATLYWTSVDLGNLGGKAAESVTHPEAKGPKGRALKVPGPVPDLEAPGIEVPDAIDEIVILGDSTSDRFTTECAILRARLRWARPGRTINVAWSLPGTDFDDLLRDNTEGDDAWSRAIVHIIADARPVEPPAAAAPGDNVIAFPATAAGERGSESNKGDATSPDSLSPSPGEDGAAPPLKPKPLGFDLEELNREWAVVLMGGRAVIYRDQPDAPLVEEQKRFFAVEAFRLWFSNRKTEIYDDKGDIKRITWAQRWLASRERRQFRGIEFHPDRGNAPGIDGYLNLWSGFAVQPASASNPNAYKTFRDHLFNNVCNGSQVLFDWVFGFFAHIVQRPRERLGVALVMRGAMGSGKTKVGEVFGRHYPRHYFLVDDPRYVTGQFNAHMATCLLLQADEAVWAGDKAAEGRLKGLITSPVQQIEAKGVDPIRLPNYVRLIMTSNEDWVVPAGKDERRFGVLDVNPRCAQNHDYFREMDDELNSGGIECLLADLLAFDLGSVNLRQIPRTDALLEQKIRSLNSVESWWFERLNSGATHRNGVNWVREVPIANLFGDYIATADRIGVKRKSEMTVFGIAMQRLVPGIDRVKRTLEVEDERGAGTMKRVWCYALPPLSEARGKFEEIVGQKVLWQSVEDGDPEPGVDADVEF